MLVSLTLEQKENAKKVYEKVKLLEKEFNSSKNRSAQDIEACYVDPYILRIWESEGQYSKETCEGWASFEDFLIDFIKQNIELE